MGRRLGQHFLKRGSILERIAAATCPGVEPLVIEIGAGRGALTGHLLPRAGRLVAIEADPLLAGRLPERFASASNLSVLRADVLATDLAQWGPAVVAGNLPYYISSPILRKVLALGPALRWAVFLLQKEVAERLAAQPGSRQYSFLTVYTLVHARAELLFDVPPSAFVPPPKVDSAVVRLTPVAPPLADLEPFLEFAGRCFTQKRKTLRNNLTGFYDRRLLAELPETARRAEQLGVEELITLFDRLRPR